MAAERRSNFALSGPLSPTQTGTRYNRFNFRDYMKTHVKKMTEAEGRKNIHMLKGTDKPEKEQDNATRAQEDEEETALEKHYLRWIKEDSHDL